MCKHYCKHIHVRLLSYFNYQIKTKTNITRLIWSERAFHSQRYSKKCFKIFAQKLFLKIYKTQSKIPCKKLYASIKNDNSWDETFKFYHCSWDKTFKSPNGLYGKIQKLLKKNNTLKFSKLNLCNVLKGNIEWK